MSRVALALTCWLSLAGLAAGQDPAPPARKPVRAGTDTGQTLRAPAERDEFSFVIFGDRTSGNDAGLDVLRRAVTMTNHLDPAFVMTVGDLVQGYNKPKRWRRQMKQYKGIMGRLGMPWYPVAGNHDVYARPRRPGGHTPLYKKHFGPLYYSFDYRWAHFVVLFTDESLAFHDKPRTQNMSPKQLAWLRQDLKGTKAKQVYVFLHHPRWTRAYSGTNWNQVHRVLAQDGRVKAVFAGHIHNYRDDGKKDGIHYYTLAVTGGKNAKVLEGTSALHHVDLVRVRRDRFKVSVVPVGAVKGADLVLGHEFEAMHDLLGGRWIQITGRPRLSVTKSLASKVEVTLKNPSERTLALRVGLSTPPGWTITSPGDQIRLGPRQTRVVTFQVKTAPLAATARLPAPRLRLSTVYSLKSGLRQPIEVTRPVPWDPVDLNGWARRTRNGNRVLELDGKSALRVEIAPALRGLKRFTLECWARGHSPRGRSALVAKTQQSSFGIFWSSKARPRPSGLIHLRGKSYLYAQATRTWRWGRWTHLALVYDGTTARLFVDGVARATAARAGTITENRLPMFIGADPDKRGQPQSFFRGAIDELRLSRTARYAASFTPAVEHQPDPETLLLLKFDASVAGLFPDHSGGGRHARAVGIPRLVPGRSWN